jgi:hypothetical protein
MSADNPFDIPSERVYRYAHKGVLDEKIGERDIGRRSLGAFPNPGHPGENIGLGEFGKVNGGVSR